MLFLRDGVEHVVHLVLHAPLSVGSREIGIDLGNDGVLENRADSMLDNAKYPLCQERCRTRKVNSLGQKDISKWDQPVSIQKILRDPPFKKYSSGVQKP